MDVFHSIKEAMIHKGFSVVAVFYSNKNWLDELVFGIGLGHPLL